MATEESSATATAVSGRLVRWLPPSPPLAVDDEPLWRPAPDPLRRPATATQPEQPLPVGVSAPGLA